MGGPELLFARRESRTRVRRTRGQNSGTDGTLPYFHSTPWTRKPARTWPGAALFADCAKDAGVDLSLTSLFNLRSNVYSPASTLVLLTTAPILYNHPHAARSPTV